MIKIRCLRDYGISLKKDKVYEARQGQKGWFAFIDETGEEYAYPPHLFEVMDAGVPQEQVLVSTN